jgi:hypothetical protein
MYVAAETAIVINGTPEAVWEYASDPSNWTASNPEEHIGLEYFDSKDNRPATGVEFYQRASVAGVYADLRGRFLHVDRPRIAVWAGTAVYRMFGGLDPRTHPGGRRCPRRADRRRHPSFS